MMDDVFYNAVENPGEMRLFCFPYLGGSFNSFSNVTKYLDGFDVYVAKPPGHWGSKKPLIYDISELTEHYIDGLAHMADKEYAFFGHSMGGVVSFALAHEITGRGLFNPPSSLILSACGCPLEFKHKKHSGLPDARLIELMVSYEAMHPEILCDTDLMNLLLPVFRADYSVLESAACKDWNKVDIPTALIWGEKDHVQSMSSIMNWVYFISESIDVFPVRDAKHMFIHDRGEETSGIISEFTERTRALCLN